MPAGPIIWAVAPPIERALVAAGRAAWAWMTSTEGAVVIGSATATAAAVAVEEKARAKAEQWLRDNAGPDVCLSCAVACQGLACGVPGSPYRGGAHWCTSLPKLDGKDSHHAPAKEELASQICTAG